MALLIFIFFLFKVLPSTAHIQRTEVAPRLTAYDENNIEVDFSDSFSGLQPPDLEHMYLVYYVPHPDDPFQVSVVKHKVVTEHGRNLALGDICKDQDMVVKISTTVSKPGEYKAKRFQNDIKEEACLTINER